MIILGDPTHVNVTDMAQLKDCDASETPVIKNSSDVQILVLGDPGVGKTSLIYSLINDKIIDEQLPPKLDDIIIPADIISENLPIKISDYSQRDFHQEDLANAIQKATVICLVYISGSHASLNRLSEFWIPTIKGVQTDHLEYKPMILVANKIDLQENSNLLGRLNHIRQKYIDVESFIEVSAIDHTNVFEVISSAKQAITHPLAPLFDTRTRTLTSRCRLALSEIFRLSDHDGDELMNDQEINLFQENCFGTPLKQDALEDLKNIIRQSIIDGIVANSLTLDGFLFLHALSIDKGRRNFTWQVLRKHKYDNQLNLKAEDSSTSEMPVPDATLSADSISGLVDETKDYLKTDPRSTIRGRELISQLDIAPWLRDNPRMVKTGLGLTVTTFISFMALKFLISRG